MKARKAHYEYFDILRAVFCVAILMYHLGQLKGGYLAVCGFFAMSSYLACMSFDKTRRTRDGKIEKVEFSLIPYYISRFKKIYLPLVIVVFITVGIVYLEPGMSWLSLKPEVNSILLGYNNFWQIGANLDYFADHKSSPFMHFWYIGILLQFTVLFPIFYVPLKKIKDELGEDRAALVSAVLAFISFCVFACMCFAKADYMTLYYNSFSRAFSLFFGIAAWFNHHKVRDFFKKHFTVYELKVLFVLILMVLIALYIFVDESPEGFIYFMTLSTIFSCLALDTVINIGTEKSFILGSISRPISVTGYELYLVQYPVLYIYQYYFGDLNGRLGGAIVIAICSLIVASIIHYAIAYSRDSRKITLFFLVAIIAFGSFGAYKYASAENYTEQADELRESLEESAEELEKAQAAYAEKLKENKEKLNQDLSLIQADKENLSEAIKNAYITAIGDSVMLGGSRVFGETFTNMYCDAKISRPAEDAIEILEDLLANEMLADIVIVHLGANGPVSDEVRDKIIELCGDRELYLIGVTNDAKIHCNDGYKAAAEAHDNVYYMDWPAYSEGHDDVFAYDGLHLTVVGRRFYSQYIYQYLYDVHMAKLEEAEAERQREYQRKLNPYVLAPDNLPHLRDIVLSEKEIKL